MVLCTFASLHLREDFQQALLHLGFPTAKFLYHAVFLTFAFSFVAGIADVVSLVEFGGFCAGQTGNVVKIGSALVKDKQDSKTIGITSDNDW